MEDDPNNLKVFSELAAETYHPLKMVEAQGLSMHPDVFDAVHSSYSITLQGLVQTLSTTNIHTASVKKVIYHTDMVSRFKMFDSGSGKQKKAKMPSGATDASSTLQDMQENYAWQHFKAKSTNQTWYSIPTSGEH